MDARYLMVADALDYLVTHQQEQPGLADLARYLGRSEAHVQRTFQAYAGLSPKQFLGMLTRERALERLRAGATVLEAALDSGLSGPGRLHDLLLRTDAITPGQARVGCAEVTLRRGIGESPFGPALVAWSERGIAFLAFARHAGARDPGASLAAQWPDARFVDDDTEAGRWLQDIFCDVRANPLPVWLRGSPFQLKVWEALMAIPPAHHASYGMIADILGRQGASRAVGAAVGRNPVAWLIPCHRVITANGMLGGYRWGLDTKRAMIGLEAARAATAR